MHTSLKYLFLLVALLAMPAGRAGLVEIAAAAGPKHVLVLYSTRRDAPISIIGERELPRSLERGLAHKPDHSLAYYSEYIDQGRFSDHAYQEAFHDFLDVKYQGLRFDAVIAIQGAAVEFAAKYQQQLFPETPIVFLALSPAPRPFPNSTGIVAVLDFASTITLAAALQPGLRNVFVVSGSGVPDQRYEAAAHEQLRPLESRYAITYLSNLPTTDLDARLAALPANSMVYYLVVYRDGAGEVFSPMDYLERISVTARAPTYSWIDTTMGHGVVGGSLLDSTAMIDAVAKLALRVLHGEPASAIAISSPNLNVHQLDWRQLRRWGISERRVAAGTVIKFREESIWDRYKVYVLGTVALLVVQATLIAGLVFERRRRVAAEIESRRNLVAMAHLDRRAAMGELAASLAHELNQPLNAILQNAGVARMLLASPPTPAELAEIEDIISDIHKDDLRAAQIIRRMRGLLQKHELESRPIDLNEVTQEAVEIVRPDAKSRQVQLDVVLADNMTPVRGDRVHLQQVLVNLLMNALDAVSAMPAERRRVRVSTSRNDREIRVVVMDTGVGLPDDHATQIFEPFYTTKQAGSGMGMGLAIARSIVEAHAGRMAAENNSGHGATVWFSVPLPSTETGS